MVGSWDRSLYWLIDSGPLQENTPSICMAATLLAGLTTAGSAQEHYQAVETKGIAGR